MTTLHRPGIHVAIPTLLLLAVCAVLRAQDTETAALAAHNADATRPDLQDPHNARFQPSAAWGAFVARDTVRTPSLLLWGGIDADRVPFLDPVFVIDAPPALPRSTGEYRITGRTDGGTELFSLDFEMPVVADGDGSSSFVFMLPVEPGWEGSLASVTLTGPGGSAILDETTHRPMVILRNPETGQIQAILRNLSARIETQAIADTAVARDPGIDVLFSRGIPDPGAWRR